MKKYKVLALFAAIALVINICAPTMVNADLIQDGKADLEVMQSDESGLYLYNGEELKVTVDGNTFYGSFWNTIDVGSSVTLEYTTPANYVFDGWFDDRDEVVSKNTTYSFTMDKEDYRLRAQISRADGKSARLEADPFWTDFGWHTPDYDVNYKTITVTNRGNLTVKDISLVYDNTKLDVVYDQSDPIFTSMAPGDSFSLQVKPISGVFEINEYSHNEWITFDGTINLDGSDKYYHSDAVIEIGVSEDGSNPYQYEENEIVVYIENFDQKPILNENLPQWHARGDVDGVIVAPEGTHWEKYNEYEARWEMAPGEPVSEGTYRYMIEIIVSRDIDETVEVLQTGDGVPENNWNVLNVDRVEIDEVTQERHIFAYTTQEYFGENQEYYSITYDPNGGTPGPEFSYEANYSGYIVITNPSESEITPPEGKAFDGFLINGMKYNVGTEYYFHENATFVYQWKDDKSNLTPIYNVHLTLEKPEIGTTNTEKIIEAGDMGYVTGTIHPVVYTQPDEQVIVTSTEWVKGTYQTAGEDFMEIFEGTIEDGQDYYAMINFEAKDGYRLDNNVEITVNNQAPDEVFAIYDDVATFVIAKIRAGEDGPSRPANQLQVWKNYGGQIAVNYTPSEPNIYDIQARDSNNWMDGGEVVQFYEGDPITVYAKPYDNYIFKGWYHVDIEWGPDATPDSEHPNPYQGEVISTDSSFTYTPNVTVVEGDTEPLKYICAVFEANTPVTVHTVFNGNGGSYKVNYNTTNEEEFVKQNIALRSAGFFNVPKGNEMTLTATPDEGYHFVGWYKTHEEDSDGQGTMVWVKDEMVSTNKTYRFIPTGFPYLMPVFEEGQEAILKGDMNKDNYVNSTDAALVLDRFKNNDATEEDFARGNMNGDNVLNSTDAAMILDVFKNS